MACSLAFAISWDLLASRIDVARLKLEEFEMHPVSAIDRAQLCLSQTRGTTEVKACDLAY
jgi:hypothetical protein